MATCDNVPGQDRRLRAGLRRIRAVHAPPILAAVLSLAACSQSHATTTATANIQSPYVALGDSYTAGPDIPNQVGIPTGCNRSDHNYPALVAQHFGLNASQVHDVSCSGATTDNLTAPQHTSDGINPAQLTTLTTETALVTLGIGGNDIGFTSILTRCVELDAPGTLIDLLRHTAADQTPCRAFYTADGTDQIGQKIQSASAHLDAALARIHASAPHARVYIVGYPDLLRSGGAACARSLGITPGDVTFLNNEELQLNNMLKQQAIAAGDRYVDTYAPSIGHDACSDPATCWIEPLLPDSAAAPMHPNATGHQGMADAVEHAITATS